MFKSERHHNFAEGEFYHIYNRGVDKRVIFPAVKDYERFLYTMFVASRDHYLSHPARQNGQHATLAKLQDLIEHEPLVRVVCFCLMPNHFHFIIENLGENNMTQFMKRLGNSYTKYFNIKYERRGYLFGGVFQSIRIDSNEYLLYLSRYIHRNPLEISGGNTALLTYRWSSLQDYITNNRWRSLLEHSIVLNQFDSPKEYQEYVNTDNDKFDAHIDPAYLLDKGMANLPRWPY